MSTWQRCEAHLILWTQKEICNIWILGTKETSRSDVVKPFFSTTWTVKDSVGKILLPHKSLRNTGPTWVPVTTRASNIALFCLELISCSVWNALYEVFGLEKGYLGEYISCDTPDLCQNILKFPFEVGPSEIQATQYESMRLYRALSLLIFVFPGCCQIVILPFFSHSMCPELLLFWDGRDPYKQLKVLL